MIEIEYSISGETSTMFTVDDYIFLLENKLWVEAINLNIGSNIMSRCGASAEVHSIQKVKKSYKVQSLEASHNHLFFVTVNSPLNPDTPCEQAPSNALERIPYDLANKPSKLVNGESSGDHAGPWAAASYINDTTKEETIGWGCADSTMCAEDAAINNLRSRLDDAILLDRGNVVISHAYVRKYARKGRLVNKISPCIHCRNNYGLALNDSTIGTSNLIKSKRGYLPC